MDDGFGNKPNGQKDMDIKTRLEVTEKHDEMKREGDINISCKRENGMTSDREENACDDKEIYINGMINEVHFFRCCVQRSKDYVQENVMRELTDEDQKRIVMLFRKSRQILVQHEWKRRKNEDKNFDMLMSTREKLRDIMNDVSLDHVKCKVHYNHMTRKGHRPEDETKFLRMLENLRIRGF